MVNCGISWGHNHTDVNSDSNGFPFRHDIYIYTHTFYDGCSRCFVCLPGATFLLDQILRMGIESRELGCKANKRKVDHMSIYNTAKKTYMHNKIAYACIICLMMIDIDLMH